MSATTDTAQELRTTAEVAARVREAAAHGAPLRIVGRGHWLDAGRPVAAAQLLPLAGLSGIVEYTPGDLTLTARAGTTLGEIARVTASERQWLTLDPFGPPAGTIGATIATASAGPLAHAFGTPRDHVLGLEAVTGEGQVIRAGGRVVKNVAGFDLTRLFTGSWGTLGAITEVTVRLRALPEVDETWALPVDESAASLEPLLEQLRGRALAPLALELVNPALAARLGVGAADGVRAVVLVRLAGNAESVRAQRAHLTTLGDAMSVPPEVWPALARAEPPGAAVARFSNYPSRLVESWTFARSTTSGSAGALLHAAVGRGVVRCIVPAGDPEALARLLEGARRFDGTVIFERLPAASWATVTPGATWDDLSRRVKHAFDPLGVCNPGILGAGS